AYSRDLDYEAFRSIADEVGAIFMVDAAHFIGLVAGRAAANPVPYADVVTATTHKALRGPRGGLVMAKKEFAKRINKGVFPDMQGGGIFSQVAAKAVCFHEASQPSFESYAAQIVSNASAMADQFASDGMRVVSGGTDNHLMLLDLRSIDEDLTGKEAATLLDERVGITLNRNGIPYDPRTPFITSGLRIGTPAMTSCGMKEDQAREIASIITAALRGRADDTSVAEAASAAKAIATAFPPYPEEFPGHV
ncbi:MAG TPA: aminotransferase class I/II-fold pyridoxal phosphate-dependent enzyme, partial [Actinobacteria bacterium]|nr:aminotransferase class I/II-fold pyridoxal phosphate-dependent enzyme [Actinomycetota bacterium]